MPGLRPTGRGRRAGLECGQVRGLVTRPSGGIARFAGEGYVASFGRQWNRYDVARDEEDEATFRVKTGVDARDLAGKLVLDAGCGGGRYALLAAKHGARVVGVDLSSAVEKAGTLCEGLPGVAIVQADLTRLPLAEGVFDLAFSIGVLHHGPDPRGAFREVARRVKPGGTAGGLALPQEHPAAGVGELGAQGGDDPPALAGPGAALRGARRPGSAACRC